jgi:hypothetical protein
LADSVYIYGDRINSTGVALATTKAFPRLMSARDERNRVLGGSRGALPPRAFSISLRDLVLSADTRATEGSERAIFRAS